MSWTREDLEKLEDAILNRATSGTLEVSFASGKSIRFESVTSMLKVRAEIIKYLNNEAMRLKGGSADYSLARF